MYKCECGKEFEKVNSFNAHKSNCKLHYLAKYGSLDQFRVRVATANTNSQVARKLNLEDKKRLALEQWLAEKHTCERCGKVMTEKFATGRFCSKACACSKPLSVETKQKISQALTKKQECYCIFCGKAYDQLNKKVAHEVRCRENPEVVNLKQSNEVIRKRAHSIHEAKLARPYITRDKNKTKLNVSFSFVENYLALNTRCEICGKTITEAVKTKGPYTPKRLCVDHDHNTNEFRGVLCSLCNRQLGWYESNKEAVNAYLVKEKPKEHS